MSEKPVTITRLEVVNFKRLKAVRIVPDPNNPIVFIRGDNGEGKSSVLQGIAGGFGGPKVLADMVRNPIRKGEDGSEVLMELSNGVKLERHWWWGTDGKLRQEVRLLAKDGAAYPAPQARIDEAIGRLTFDPLAFMKLEPKKQAEAVRQVAGVDLSKFDASRLKLYEERTGVNRDVESLKARIAALPPPSGKQRVAVKELVERLRKLTEEEQAAKDLTTKRNLARESYLTAARDVASAHDEVERAQKALDAAKKVLAARVAAADTKKRDADEAETAEAQAPILGPDIAEVQQQLAECEATNAAVAKDELHDQLGEELDDAVVKSEELTEGIAKVDGDKAAALAAAKLPVPGLSFTADGVLLDGFPFEDCSTAAQLKVSLAMGIALNPKIGVLLIRSGNDLDEANLALVAKMAADAGVQVWIEVVPKGDVGWVIEDGEVVSANGKPPEEPAKKPKRALKAV